MNEDEAKDYLLQLELPFSASYVKTLLAGVELGKKIIKDKVSKRFAISHIDWREYERNT
jgi:hypothetical protein